MKLRLNRNERVLVGASMALSLIAVSALVYWFIAYFRLSIAGHYLTINVAGSESASTDLILVGEFAVLVGVVCSFVAAALHRRRVRASDRRASRAVEDESLQSG
jgi:hypothetical protein